MHGMWKRRPSTAHGAWAVSLRLRHWCRRTAEWTPDGPLRRSVIAVGVGLLLIGGATGCGKGADKNAAIVVGDRVITREMISQGMAAIAASGSILGSHPVPKAPVPPKYSACIEYLRTYEPAPPGTQTKSSPSQLKLRCRIDYERDKLKSIYFWISYEWVAGEAARQGVRASALELKKQRALFEGGFSTKEDFRHYMAKEKMSPAEFAATLKLAILTTKIQQKLEGASGVRGLTRERRQQILDEFGAAFRKRWMARTDCRKDYVVPVCKQYERSKYFSKLTPPSVPLANMTAE
jgi:hypothetical protein